ncbi:hypothetical protein HMI55_003479, partial [Coelomomyces lativittatus]
AMRPLYFTLLLFFIFIHVWAQPRYFGSMGSLMSSSAKSPHSRLHCDLTCIRALKSFHSRIIYNRAYSPEKCCKWSS